MAQGTPRPPQAKGLAAHVVRFADRLGMPAPLLVVITIATASIIGLVVLLLAVRRHPHPQQGRDEAMQAARPVVQVVSSTAREGSPSTRASPPAASSTGVDSKAAPSSSGVDSKAAPPPARREAKEPAPFPIGSAAPPRPPRPKKKGLGHKLRSLFR
jgi:hypothetical protein